MADVVSFRPDDEEAAAIERTRREMNLRTRAEAVRHLVRIGAQHTGKASLRKFLSFRISELEGKSLSSREIDDLVYGDP